MSDSSGSLELGSVLGAVKRRKDKFGLFFIIALAIGLGVSWTLPSVYRAQTTVLIERQIPANFVATTVTGNVQERLQVIQQRAFTRQNLLDLAREMELLPAVSGELSEEARIIEDEVVDEILANLYLDLVDVKVTEDRSGRTGNVVVSFNVAYESYDPGSSASFANKITNLLLSENQSIRSEQSVQVTSFLEEAQSRLKSEIQQVENEISLLSQQSYDSLPEQLSEARKEISRSQEELVVLNGEVSFLESQLAQLRQRLSETPKHVVTGNASVQGVQDPKVRLQQARLELKVALQSFTESHPDVIRLRQLISDLESEIASGDVQGAGLVMPSNPEYLLLMQQQNEAEAKLDSVRARKLQVESYLLEKENRVRANPAIELKYNQLVRDLERAQTEYADIKSRLYEAQLAQSLELEQKGEKFTLISEAFVPREPVWPNRIALSVLSLVFGLIVGLSRVLVSEMGDNTLNTSKDVQLLIGQKPLAVIPTIDLTNI